MKPGLARTDLLCAQKAECLINQLYPIAKGMLNKILHFIRKKLQGRQRTRHRVELNVSKLC